MRNYYTLNNVNRKVEIDGKMTVWVVLEKHGMINWYEISEDNPLFMRKNTTGKKCRIPDYLRIAMVREVNAIPRTFVDSNGSYLALTNDEYVNMKRRLVKLLGNGRI